MEKHFKQLIIARRDLNILDEDIYDNWILRRLKN